MEIDNNTLIEIGCKLNDLLTLIRPFYQEAKKELMGGIPPIAPAEAEDKKDTADSADTSTAPQQNTAPKSKWELCVEKLSAYPQLKGSTATIRGGKEIIIYPESEKKELLLKTFTTSKYLQEAIISTIKELTGLTIEQVRVVN